MERPLKRIIEIGSDDQFSVAKYYSSQLFNFIKSVLYIIPVNIFHQLDGISTILQVEVEEFEVKIAKTLLKEKAAFKERFNLAKRTHEVVLFTEGMLVLDKVLMGVIEIDPKEILVDGLRKELSKKLAGMLHEGFIFDYNLLKAWLTGQPLPQGTQIGDFGILESKFKNIKTKFRGL